MNDENIFKLLLIILLMGNNGSDCGERSFLSSVNDVILMAMLMGFTGGQTFPLGDDGGATSFS